MASPPLLWDIESDPVLADVKLIAEAWDAAGLYQVGSFLGDSWKEWNGRFRDDVRAFMKGDAGTVHSLAFRLTGSPDVFGHEEREAEQSINFVTCHDGFTLNDLVSYNTKHNEANGHDNGDGASDNLSWNCGVEGPSDDPAVERLRNRQVKNFLTLTMLAVGTPMLLMGDEVRRTQRGNNNAYCLNDDTTWFDWDFVVRHGDVHRFAKELIALRTSRNLPIERLDMTLQEMLRHQPVDVAWHQVECAGLGSRVAYAGSHGPPGWRPGPAPHHRQRLLGGARIRDPSARRCAAGVAAHHRHLPRFTRRRVRMGGRADRTARDVWRAGSLRGAPDRDPSPRPAPP